MTQAKDKLIGMLAARGVESCISHDIYVEWAGANGRQVTAFESSGDRGTVMLHAHLTPEQAVAATLGPPTCTIEPANRWEEDFGVYTCSNCGEKWSFECEGPRYHHWTCCPACRAVIECVEPLS